MLDETNLSFIVLSEHILMRGGHYSDDKYV